MSGFNKRTGVFELTFTKAESWYRRQNAPTECGEQNGMGFFACVLRHYGLNVTHVGDTFLRVKATPGQVWEASSGQPSDPQREAYYTT